MKKWTCALCVLLSMVYMSTAAMAADICKNMGGLYQRWSMNGMPEWVCAVVSADGSDGYNELLSVQDAISREYMGADGKSPMVSIATGLAVIDGKVTGFGQSGKELRAL